METKKRRQREFLVIGILFLVFNILAFTIPFQMTAAFWTAYTFDWIAAFVQIPIFFTAFKKDGDIKSRFYGFPIARLGVTYLCIQLVAGFVVMALSPWIPVKIAIALFAVILAVAAVGFIGADAVREEIERQDIKLQETTGRIKELRSMAAYIAGQCEDGENRELLNQLAEKLRFSDPVSSEALSDIEEELAICINELKKVVVEKDSLSISAYCKKAMSVLDERNRLCKLNKQKSL